MIAVASKDYILMLEIFWLISSTQSLKLTRSYSLSLSLVTSASVSSGWGRCCWAGLFLETVMVRLSWETGELRTTSPVCLTEKQIHFHLKSKLFLSKLKRSFAFYFYFVKSVTEILSKIVEIFSKDLLRPYESKFPALTRTFHHKNLSLRPLTASTDQHSTGWF